MAGFSPANSAMGSTAADRNCGKVRGSATIRPCPVSSVLTAAGIGVLLGSTVEMGPGTLAQLHLAATVPNLTLPSDLIGPGMYKDDVLVKRLNYERGKLKIPRGPGLGGNVDRRQLAALKFS